MDRELLFFGVEASVVSFSLSAFASAFSTSSFFGSPSSLRLLRPRLEDRPLKLFFGAGFGVGFGVGFGAGVSSCFFVSCSPIGNKAVLKVLLVTGPSCFGLDAESLEHGFSFRAMMGAAISLLVLVDSCQVLNDSSFASIDVLSTTESEDLL
jgi:hypothetical protein